MSRPTAHRPLLASELLDLMHSGVLHLSLTDAARVLGLGEDRARRLAAAGDFPVPVFAVGRSIRVPVAGLTRLLGLNDDAVLTAPNSQLTMPANKTAPLSESPV